MTADLSTDLSTGLTIDLGTLTFIAFYLALFSGGCLLMALSLYLLKLWDARKQQQSMNATYDHVMTLCDRQNREEINAMLRRTVTNTMPSSIDRY